MLALNLSFSYKNAQTLAARFVIGTQRMGIRLQLRLRG
jgi:hypothetical protein